MRPVFPRKRLAALLPFILSAVIAGASLYYLSTIYEASVTVSVSQLMTIRPGADTPLPTEALTGQSFNVSVDVENPNSVAIKGRILITFTATGIALDSVSITSDWKDPPVYLLWADKSLSGDTLSFKLYPNYSPDPYFTFEPGSNPCVMYFSVTYNKAGTYAIDLAIVAY